MSLKRKLRLFKNDPFGVKAWYFDWLLHRSLRRRNKLYTQCLRICLDVIHEIGIPRNDEEAACLKKAVERYEEINAELNDSLRYAKLYIKCKEENDNEEITETKTDERA